MTYWLELVATILIQGAVAAYVYGRLVERVHFHSIRLMEHNKILQDHEKRIVRLEPR
jgi:hypothetical protein